MYQLEMVKQPNGKIKFITPMGGIKTCYSEQEAKDFIAEKQKRYGKISVVSDDMDIAKNHKICECKNLQEFKEKLAQANDKEQEYLCALATCTSEMWLINPNLKEIVDYAYNHSWKKRRGKA